jgi:hypothetical protein
MLRFGFAMPVTVMEDVKVAIAKWIAGMLRFAPTQCCLSRMLKIENVLAMTMLSLPDEQATELHRCCHICVFTIARFVVIAT